MSNQSTDASKKCQQNINISDYETKIKTWWKQSWTIAWGHVQVAGGAVITAMQYFTPNNFPHLPIWVYGVGAMGAGLLTYALRIKTEREK